MSFAGLLKHALTVERLIDTGTFDDYNQPVREPETIASVRGLPQPKRIREVILVSEAGAVVGAWTIFLEPIDVREADRVLHDAVTCPMPGVTDLPTGTWEITGIRNPAGWGHHLEVDATLLTPA